MLSLIVKITDVAVVHPNASVCRIKITIPASVQADTALSGNVLALTVWPNRADRIENRPIANCWTWIKDSGLDRKRTIGSRTVTVDACGTSFWIDRPVRCSVL